MDNGGTYPVKTLVAQIAILIGITVVFDAAFFFINYHTNQRSVGHASGRTIYLFIYISGADSVVQCMQCSTSHELICPSGFLSELHQGGTVG